MTTGSEQDKMFERYAPIQRKVKPSIWRETIRQALASKPAQWPTFAAPPSDESSGSGPRSLKVWAERHPERYERLQRVRQVINQIAEDTRTPPEIIIKPQIIRSLCWSEDPASMDVAEFLSQQGARDWQVHLVAASVSRVII